MIELDPTVLRQRRYAAGLSERGLARALATSASRIRRWETGQAHDRITLGELARLTDILDIDFSDLINISGPAHQVPLDTEVLALNEARLIEEAASGDPLVLIARGSRGIAMAHLLATGALTRDSTATAGRTVLKLSPKTLRALDLPSLD